MARGAGVGLVALGGLITYWAVVQPLQLAQSGAAEISFELRGLFLVPWGFIFGLLYIFGGEKADTLVRQEGQPRFTKWGWVISIGSAAIGALVYWWFTTQIAAMGYVQA
ncbi:hypothetical protein GCM10009101_17150 [Brevundimonas lenta]